MPPAGVARAPGWSAFRRCFGPSGAADVRAAGACVACGLVLLLLPNLIEWARTGGPAWVGDLDEVVYLGISAEAYAEHPAYLTDVVRGDDRPDLSAWLQSIPPILAARALGLGPMGIGLMYRVLAGVGLGLGWYLVARPFFGRPWVAATVAVLLLSDVGTLKGRPLIEAARLTAGLASGRVLWIGGDAFSASTITNAWRVTTPAVVLPYLLLFAALLVHARERPTWPRLVAAGVACGLLFHSYFFYWTAAGLALFLGVVADRGHRRAYFHAGWIGLLIGLPEFLAATVLKGQTAPEVLHRMDLGTPIPRFSELILSRVEIALLAGCLPWIWAARRTLLPAWFLAVAGWLLCNHQVLSGMTIQNYHWRLMIQGPFLSLCLVVLVAGAALARWPRAAAGALLALAALTFGSGVALRASEAVQSYGSRTQTGLYRRYEAQRRAPGAPELVPHSVVAGDEGFVGWATVLDLQRPLAGYLVRCNLDVDNDEWMARDALNAYLLGRDAAAFERQQREMMLYPHWGPWARDPARLEAMLGRQRAAFAAVEADPESALERFNVRYVALPADQAPPAYLEEGWRRREDGPSWQVWERADAAGRATSTPDRPEAAPDPLATAGEGGRP